MKPNLKEVAFHEAGHAVLALSCDVSFLKVTIKQTGKALGLVKLKVPAWELETLHCGRLTCRAQVYNERLVVAALAGPLAAAVFTRRRPTGSDSDMAFADCTALILACNALTLNVIPSTGTKADRATTAAANAHLRYLRCVARNAVAVNWPAIKAVAHALLQRETLTRREVARIAGPLLAKAQGHRRRV
jgi:hypothetical protein